MVPRILAVLAAAFVLIAANPHPARACQWVPPALEEAPIPTFLFVGTVTSAIDNSTYEVDVLEAFRGDVPATVRFSPTEPVRSSCDAFLDAGSTYLFATDELGGGLGIGNIWFQVTGDTAQGVFFQQYVQEPMSTDALYAFLRGLPDTALPAPDPAVEGAGTVRTGLALLLAATLLAAGTAMAHRRR